MTTLRIPRPTVQWSEDRIPADPLEVLGWLDAMPPERDDLRIAAALAAVADPTADPVDRDIAVARLARTIRGLVLATLSQMAHGWHRYTSETERAQELVDVLLEVISKTKAREPGQFIYYATRAFRFAGFPSVRRARFEVAVSSMPTHELEGTTRGLYETTPAAPELDPLAVTAVLGALDAAITQETGRDTTVGEALRHFFGVGSYAGAPAETVRAAAEAHQVHRTRVSEALARVRARLEDEAARGLFGAVPARGVAG